MSAYVDQIVRYKGRLWCHLFADSLDELHEFAGRLQLRRLYFQDKRVPHYDLSTRRRFAAVRLGAIEVKTKDYLRCLKGVTKGASLHSTSEGV